MDVEEVCAGIVLLVGAVDRAVAASLRVAHAQRRHIRKQRAPVDTESLTLAISREVRLPTQAQCAGAVVVIVIADRARKVASREEVRSPENPFRPGEGLIVGIGPRLVVVGSRFERQEVGIVVGTGNLAVESKVQAVVGWDRIAVVARVSEGEKSTNRQFRVVADFELCRSGLCHYQNCQPDDVLRSPHSPSVCDTCKSQFHVPM
jgi:hypothetical protein